MLIIWLGITHVAYFAAPSKANSHKNKVTTSYRNIFNLIAKLSKNSFKKFAYRIK